VLIWRLELKVCLEVHLGLLPQDVGSNKVLHIETFFLLLLFALPHYLILGLILELLKFELFFLIEGAVWCRSGHAMHILF